MLWSGAWSCVLLAAGCLVVAFPPGAGASGSSAPFIDPAVRRQVETGRARVVVSLRVADAAGPDEDLDEPERAAARRQAIDAAQSAVLAALSGTAYAVVRRYRTVPFLALQIEGDALRVLEGLDGLVARVFVDVPVPPLRPPTSIPPRPSP